MLEVKRLSAQLGERYFQWDFLLPQGLLLAVIGASGLGKSTLLNVLCGLQNPIGGDVFWRGESLLGMPVAQRPFSVLFQSNNLFDHLSVETNLALGLQPSGKLTEAQHDRLHTAARRFDLHNLLSRRPDQLSGGQQQRVALARVFLQQKPVLLLDEPFSSLDPALRQEGLNWVQEIQREHNSSVILVTHHLDEMLTATDAVLLGLQSEQWLNLSLADFQRKRREGAFDTLLGQFLANPQKVE
ncbi:ATP-binding cassette domain-containing protein [Saccharospirillum mangrovi]|uniref:thiamine ABC transporter ATP-binding protein n=1 Tax=Saccharospirillum mangrovi TaxID=2161747 RepID=UPI000D33FB34|nr:ATP-binding cassette domain-containing protein [Saccharospirillum mangrovi]